jgi:hypothetical protein
LAFAGDDITTAKYYPVDDEYLLDRETTVAHFEVLEPGATIEDGARQA